LRENIINMNAEIATMMDGAEDISWLVINKCVI